MTATTKAINTIDYYSIFSVVKQGFKTLTLPQAIDAPAPIHTTNVSRETFAAYFYIKKWQTERV